MAAAIPYEFVIDYLPANVMIKKMFGMYYIYWGKKIMLILRNRDNLPEFNGIWVATDKNHHETLKNEVPELGPFFLSGDERPGNWLMIPDDSENFEQAAIKVCELIAHGDARIGKVTEKAPL
jgi:hypothetical protein